MSQLSPTAEPAAAANNPVGCGIITQVPARATVTAALLTLVTRPEARAVVARIATAAARLVVTLTR
jgi:hypothetical protein